MLGQVRVKLTGRGVRKMLKMQLKFLGFEWGHEEAELTKLDLDLNENTNYSRYH